MKKLIYFLFCFLSIFANSQTVNTFITTAKAQSRVIIDVVPSSTVTSATTETLLKTYTINSGTYLASDFLKIPILRATKTGTNGIMTLRIRIGTTNSFSTSLPLLATSATGTAAMIELSLSRVFTIAGGNIVGFTASGSSATGIGTSSTADTSTAIDVTQPFYLFMTIQLASGLDSVVQKAFTTTN